MFHLCNIQTSKVRIHHGHEDGGNNNPDKNIENDTQLKRGTLFQTGESGEDDNAVLERKHTQHLRQRPLAVYNQKQRNNDGGGSDNQKILPGRIENSAG